MRDTGRHTLLDRTFAVGLVLKGLDGAFELIGGLVLLFVSPDQIREVVGLLTRRELTRHPHDFIAGAIAHWANGIDVSATLFIAIYLLAHGVVKVVLVIAVLRDQLWAYPWLIGFLVAFIGYQVFELFRHFGWGLFLLTAFDVFIVVLTWREYGLHRRSRAEAVAAASAAAPT
jgi:uncharacterized membrane protein